jgi:hypothetical protein
MTAADLAHREFAPAKVNLYLHLRGRRADGYHLLDSLAVFPAVGDWVSVAQRSRLGLSLEICGPFGGALSTGLDNLVLRAARALAATHGLTPNAAIRLEKNLPIAIFLSISIASVLSAPPGARLAHRLDQARLKKVFASFIAMLGLLMLGKSLSGQ